MEKKKTAINDLKLSIDLPKSNRSSESNLIDKRKEFREKMVPISLNLAPAINEVSSTFLQPFLLFRGLSNGANTNFTA